MSSRARRKLDALRAAGIEPFPHAYPGVQPIAAVKAAHADLEDGEETDVRDPLAGRLVARRGQGKVVFRDLVDRPARCSCTSARRAGRRAMYAARARPR